MLLSSASGQAGAEQVIPVLGPAGRPIPHHQLDASRMHEVVKVTPGGHPAEAGEIRHLGGGKVTAGLLQDPQHQVQRGSG